MAKEVTKYFIQRIEAWMEEEKKRDPLFADQVKASGKTAEGACNYVLSEVRKSGQCGYDDAEVYGMVRHFFDEDDVKDPGEQDVQRIVVSGHVDLSESEKAEAMERAVREYKAEMQKKADEEREAKEKAERERLEALKAKRKEQMANDAQLDLFGGL